MVTVDGIRDARPYMNRKQGVILDRNSRRAHIVDPDHYFNKEGLRQKPFVDIREKAPNAFT